MPEDRTWGPVKGQGSTEKMVLGCWVWTDAQRIQWANQRPPILGPPSLRALGGATWVQWQAEWYVIVVPSKDDQGCAYARGRGVIWRTPPPPPPGQTISSPKTKKNILSGKMKL